MKGFLFPFGRLRERERTLPVTYFPNESVKSVHLCVIRVLSYVKFWLHSSYFLGRSF